MKVEEFLRKTHDFFDECQYELEQKSPDYSTNGEMLGDIYGVAKDMDLRPSFVAYIQARKHLQAIDTWMKHTHLNSEGIQHRLMDAANYMAILSIIVGEEIHDMTPTKTVEGFNRGDTVNFPTDIPHPHQGTNDASCDVCHLAKAAKVHHVMVRPPNYEGD